MVGISKGSVAFIKATDYLKGLKRLKHGDIAKNIGLTRSQYDQSRGGRRRVLEVDIENLIKSYPETSSFFEDIKENLTEPSGDFFSKNENESELVKSLNQLIKAKDDIIEMKDAKIKDLELELVAAHLAHEKTLKALYSEEEMSELYEQKLKELEALKKLEKK